MLNLYATPSEIKVALPDGIRSTTTSYDELLLRLANRASRYIDRYCDRVFYPALATRYFQGPGGKKLLIPDLLSLTSLAISDDDGATYTTLTLDTDFRLTWWGDHNDPRSWNQIVIDPNSTQGAWPTGFRAIKIVGLWAYADDRDTAWEPSTDTVQSNPLAAGATSLLVADADGVDQLGITPRFQAGQLQRIESEFIYTSLVAAGTSNTLTIARARNGTVDAAHVQGKAIDIWRPPDPVKQAAIIQIVRLFERGTIGFSDSRANAELGQMFWTKAMDPEARALLDPYRKMTAG